MEKEEEKAIKCDEWTMSGWGERRKLDEVRGDCKTVDDDNILS
jgi:hypothetical protein